MNPYDQGHRDANLGSNPAGAGYHGKEYEEYMAGYYATVYGMEVGKNIGDSLGALANIILLLAFRLPFLYPAIFIFYAFCKWGLYGSGLGDFMANFSSYIIPLGLSMLFIFVPITIIWYNLYLYLRGLEFARYISKKPNQILFIILGVYTVVGSSMLLIVMVNAFPFTYQYYWIKLLLLVIILPNIFRYPIEFHWKYYREGNYFKKYKYFRKGFLSQKQDSNQQITFEEVKILSWNIHEKMKSRLKVVKVISYLVAIVIFLLLDIPSASYTWYAYILPKIMSF